MGDLSLDLRLEGSGGRYSASISPDWVVFTPNGGFLAALALAAAGEDAAGRSPTSLSCHFLNVPSTGEVQIDVTTLRASRRAASSRVLIEQAGTTVVEALVWSAATEADSPRHATDWMPDVPPPEALWSWSSKQDGSPADGQLTLWRNIDARLVGWPRDQDWEARPPGPPIRHEWCRFRPRATFDDPWVDAARSLILIDTLMFPAALMTHTGPMTHIAPSLDLTVWFHGDARQDEWLLCEAASPMAGSGLVAGTGRIWTRDGRLIASGGQQMLARRVIPQETRPKEAAKTG